MGSTDLIITGKYGVLNQQKLLNATSNNINNVNTVGFIRKETQTYTSCVDWGVGATYTRRIYDQYVQRQMYSDCSDYNYYKAYAEGLDTTDRLLSDENMSVANSMSDFFDELSTAASLPTSTANRQAAMAKLETVVNRFQTANESMFDSLNDVNNRIHDSITEINSLTRSIANINYEIRSMALSDNHVNNEIYLQMLDERDRLTGELSKLMSVKVVEQDDGTYEIYMSTGMLLANGDSYGCLTDERDSFDSTKRHIYLSYENTEDASRNIASVQLTIDSIGGALGGYLNATKELRDTMRELGKLAVSFADAINEQNKAGFTLEDKAGEALLKIENVQGVSSDSSVGITCNFIKGKGENVQAYDFEIIFVQGASKPSVYLRDQDDKRIDVSNLAVIDGSKIYLKENGAIDGEDLYGVYFDIGTDVSNLPVTGTSRTVFYVQPTVLAASTMYSLINKPEDFAFASAVRTRTGDDNYGNAVISLTSCYATGSDYGVSVNTTTREPEFNNGAPNKIIIDANGDYNVYFHNATTGTDTLLGTAPASCKGVNVFANTVWNTAHTSGYPGYEVSIAGTVKQNDVFTVEINSGGQADNSNANALTALRSEKLTRTTGSEQVTTLNEGYANLLAKIGSASNSAKTNTEAAEAKYEQTVKMFESNSGVNLDEEATNLLMFQQSYQACAKIIEASQTIFNALIAAF
ncbi:flagellar hook-associated protein 1 FlgK [Succinivibrio dextrinosolvens]|uniref:flagellar hook-associated protein FlgK n=1 Tax=Succinivibrio dextrinosolvens TaxID=83771 RepID=UPI0008F0E1CC|nr:flagellar hook-associated protein FlgK [Succinivibrio dextrinosolvens]SFS46842.1 flagellar hook-associated protein 1 FlgK [Succinivibrio dextrinosolvens]